MKQWQRRQPISYLRIALSLFVATFLSLVPFSGWLAWLRPDWLLLWVAYWLLVSPGRVGLLSVLFASLLFDVIYGVRFGAHGLAILPIAYTLLKYQRQLELYTIAQQTLVMIVLALFQQILALIIHAYLLGVSVNRYHWLVILATGIWWPVWQNIWQKRKMNSYLVRDY